MLGGFCSTAATPWTYSPWPWCEAKGPLRGAAHFTKEPSPDTKQDTNHALESPVAQTMRTSLPAHKKRSNHRARTQAWILTFLFHTPHSGEHAHGKVQFATGPAALLPDLNPGHPRQAMSNIDMVRFESKSRRFDNRSWQEITWFYARLDVGSTSIPFGFEEDTEAESASG